MRLLLAACLLALVLGLGNTASREPERRALDDMEPGKAMVMAIHRYHEHVGELSFSGNLKTGLRCAAWCLFYLTNTVLVAREHHGGSVLLTVTSIALVFAFFRGRRATWSEAAGSALMMMLNGGVVFFVFFVLGLMITWLDIALLH